MSLVIDRQVIEYQDPNTGIAIRQYVLIAKTPKINCLLSHANLFLMNEARSSLNTSNRYSSILSMFYRFLSTEPNFANKEVANYHALVTNFDIRRWQVSRQTERIAKQSSSPSSETIYEDAKILLGYFHWLNNNGYLTNVNVQLKTCIANFKSERMLAYIQAKARVTKNAKNIRVLDKEARQFAFNSLITSEEIRQYLTSFVDPAYAVMFKLALGTAMRPIDLCKFPYIGDRKNVHILPYSEMDSEKLTFEYTAYGSKGNKTRTIVIHRDDLKMLDECYIKPLYDDRRKRYKERYGKDCPLSVLFLNEQGVPITPKMTTSRGTAAKKKALENYKGFRDSIVFYDSRHWWPTIFLIQFFGDDLLTKAVDYLWAACGEALKTQMGHSDLETTFAHYVDKARVMMGAAKGRTTELITQAHAGVHAVIGQIENGKLTDAGKVS
ncbi:site-specific integrase [Pseudomonas sp. Pseu.R1]|uniref:site-specific integrase n=1 Tax=Pseudomonas sp. Pseu.R1 TaxID=3379818 RepID=UPI003B9420A3